MTISPRIFDALRLTRAGDLGQATAAIQAALAGGQGAPSRPVAFDGDAIDITPTRVTLAGHAPCDGASDRQAKGSFAEMRHSGTAGSIDYRLYVPASFAPGMPLLVMLHGCTQTPEDFARGTGMNALADTLGFVVAYPRQPQSANAQKCWNWFRANDQQRDRGEPALIAGIARDVLRDLQADPSRVYVAGLSAGGAAAAIMAARYPDLFAAVGVHSGLACGSARNLPSALSAMRNGGGRGVQGTGHAFVPVITFHGDRDSTVHAVNSAEIVAGAAAAFAEPLDSRVEKGRFGPGRNYTRDMKVDAAGRILIEQWTIHGAGHAWSGGQSAGSYTDPAGPDASREMLRFLLGHKLGDAPGGSDDR